MQLRLESKTKNHTVELKNDRDDVCVETEAEGRFTVVVVVALVDVVDVSCHHRVNMVAKGNHHGQCGIGCNGQVIVEEGEESELTSCSVVVVVLDDAPLVPEGFLSSCI